MKKRMRITRTRRTRKMMRQGDEPDVRRQEGGSRPGETLSGEDD